MFGSAASETSFEDSWKTTGSWLEATLKIASDTMGWLGPNMTAPFAIPRPERAAAMSSTSETAGVVNNFLMISLVLDLLV